MHKERHSESDRLVDYEVILSSLRSGELRNIANKIGNSTINRKYNDGNTYNNGNYDYSFQVEATGIKID